MIKYRKFRILAIKRYDRIVKALFAILIGLSVTSCEEPDEPMPEYGVIVPMYGVKTTLIDE